MSCISFLAVLTCIAALVTAFSLKITAPAHDNLDFPRSINNRLKLHPKHRYARSLTDQDVTLVLPPPLPSLHDASVLPRLQEDSIKDPTPLPIISDGEQTVIPPVLKAELTEKMVKQCTPDCTLPHCTTACKCANSHATVHQMCNPPPVAALVKTCGQWYNKCPMYSPLHYGPVS